MVAHVPVAIPPAEGSERVAVGEGQSVAADDNAGLRAAALAVALVVVAPKVVVVVSGGKGGEPRGVAAVALTLARRGPDGHPAGVRVAKLVTVPGAFSSQGDVWQLSRIWTRRGGQNKRE